MNARCCLRQQKNNFFFHAGCLFMFNIQSHCYCLGVFFKPKCLRFNSNVFLQCIELYQVNSQIAAIHHSNHAEFVQVFSRLFLLFQTFRHCCCYFSISILYGKQINFIYSEKVSYFFSILIFSKFNKRRECFCVWSLAKIGYFAENRRYK